MAVHYQSVMERYGMCPIPVAIGFNNTGKSTAARTALALLGTPQFFIREFTTTQTPMLSIFYLFFIFLSSEEWVVQRLMKTYRGTPLTKNKNKIQIRQVHTHQYAIPLPRQIVTSTKNL